MQYVVATGQQFAQRTSVFLQDKSYLVEENRLLNKELLLTKVQAQRTQALLAENRSLKSLNLVAKTINEKFVIAHLTYIHTDPFAQQFLLNYGAKQQIYIGQPVLDASGVIGQIIRVGPDISLGAFVTDPKVAVPVYDMRSREQGITVGMGRSGQMKLQYITADKDIKVGDKIVTSGRGEEFIADYPLGYVSKVTKKQDFPFLDVRIKPIADIGNVDYVLLMWFSANQPLKVKNFLKGDETSHDNK